MSARLAAAIAGVIGFAVMALELTAVRLLAPFFGDSAYVWTNVIGVILVALAAGAYLGGRMADRELGRDRLFVLLLAGGVLTALVPVLGPALGAWLVPADIPLDSAMTALVRGSLTATTLLFAPPVLMVACSSPMLVALLAREDGRVGRASGLVSWTATVGSLVGTFAATHLLIPEFGSRKTVWIASGCLVAAALMCRLSPVGVAGLLIPLALPWWAPDLLKPAVDGTVVAEVESGYQFLQVVEYDKEPKRTALRINEGLDSFHSIAYAGTAFTGGSYYDYHVVTPFLAGDGAAPPNLRVLSLGEAAGTFGRLFAAVHEMRSMDAVEIDPAVTALGAAYFHGKRPEGDSFALDARVFVDCTQRTYDVVLVDTYKHQIYVPAHVASVQFFESVRRILSPGGVVSVNAGGTRFSDPVIQAMCSTMAAVFGRAHAFRVPNSRNFLLAARKDVELDPACLQKVSTRNKELGVVLKRMGAPTLWRSFLRGRVVLEDDRPFLDKLQEDVYSRRAEDPELIPMGGTRPADAVADEARRLRLEGRPEDALALLAAADRPTGALRWLAGDCRWMLRDAGGAVAEYEEAKRLGMQGLEESIAGAQEEFDGRIEAWEAGSRNGWLALGAALGLTTVVFLLRGW